MDKIETSLQMIKEQTGLNLKLDAHFSGIKEHKSKKYFNVELDTPVFCSTEYNRLLAYSSKYKTIKVEPNGQKRLAIFIL
jgi:hypothetical protein